MKFPFARELFPDFELAQHEIAGIDAKADALLNETLANATQLLELEHGLVNEQAWKKLKQFDSSLTLYRERKPGSTGMRARSATFAGRDDTTTTTTPPPSFLLVGQLLCGLDDLMFGVSTATAEEQRIRSSYVADGIVDCQLLQQLRTPQLTAPFHHRNLKWLATNPSNHVPLTKPRDYVVVDDAGIVDNTAGDPRIGYSLRHSVQLEGVAPLCQLKIARGAMSLCGVFHEVYPSVVHVYVHMTFEHRARRGINNRLATAAALEYALALTQMGPIVAHMKKLTSAVQATERSLDHVGECNPLATSYGSNATSVSSSSSNLGSSFRRTQQKRGNDACGACCQAIKTPTTPDNVQDASCALCRQLLCRLCRVRHELSFVGRYHRVHRSKYAFCRDCVAHTADRNAAQVAVVDQTQREQNLLTKSSSAKSSKSRSTTTPVYEQEDRAQGSTIIHHHRAEWR